MEEWNRGHIAQARIHNTYNRPIRLVSGEIKELNNRLIAPGQGIMFMMQIPEGFRNYSTQYWGLNNEPTVYVGWVLEDAGDDSGIVVF